MYRVAMFLHSDVPSLNFKGSGEEKTLYALHPLQLELSVPTAINSSVFTTAISPSSEKGAKRTNTCRPQMWQQPPTHTLLPVIYNRSLAFSKEILPWRSLNVTVSVWKSQVNNSVLKTGRNRIARKPRRTSGRTYIAPSEAAPEARFSIDRLVKAWLNELCSFAAT